MKQTWEELKSNRFRPPRRRAFLLGIGTFQTFLAIRYLDPERYLLSSEDILKWTQILESIHVTIVFLVCGVYSIVAGFIGKGVKAAFALASICFSILAFVWLGSIFFAGIFAALPTGGMYLTLVYIIWLASGVIDTPKKVMEDV